MNKIEKFKKRNRRRNKHLYEKGLIEEYDYIICPVSKERLSIIKSSYIIKILGMTVEEYDKKYPNQQKCCKKRGENISKGLLKINPKTGKKRAVEIQEKARITLTKPDKNGLTGDEKRAKKTKESNFKNIIDGKNGYQRTAETRNNVILDNGLSIQENGLLKNIKKRKENCKSAVSYKEVDFYWIIYQRFSRYLTDKTIKKSGIKKEKGKHIDHIHSVCHGYINEISPFVISNIKNLRKIDMLENLQKNFRSDITKEKLLKICNITEEENKSQYNKFIEVIEKDEGIFNIEILEELCNGI